MKSTVTDLDDNRVKLSVEVDETEFDVALDQTFRKIAREVRIPGFRPGKAPRRILEARIGREVARGEALRDAIPDYYGAAVREHAVDAIAPPDIDITGGESDGPVVFDAVVEVRPHVQVQGYEALRVELPSPVASDAEVEVQIDRIRDQFADLVDVDRPAIDGDHVLMDITGSVDGEEIPGLTADDYSYEVGLGALVPELDDNLRGSAIGHILAFTAEHPQTADVTIDFKVLVKGVRAKVPPEPTDEWVATNTEHETHAELVADTRARLSATRRARSASMLRDRVAAAAGALVEGDPPEAMVDSAMEDQLQNLVMALQAQGARLEQWLAMTGQTPDDFRSQLRETAAEAAKVDLALRAVADAEAIAVTEDDVDAEIAHMGEPPAMVHQRLVAGDGLIGLRAELVKRAALDWLTERVEIFDDESGEPIDREALDTSDDEVLADDPVTSPHEPPATGHVAPASAEAAPAPDDDQEVHP